MKYSPILLQKIMLVLCLTLGVTTFAAAQCVFSKPLDARELDVGNMLSWSTFKEDMALNFLIQRSVDGAVFETISKVKGAGKSKDLKHYRYLDARTGDVRVFYRLVQVDNKEQEYITKTVIVNRTKPNNFVVKGMTSPMTVRYFTITLASKIKTNATFEVLDARKKVVKMGSVGLIDGANLISVDLNDLPNAKYEFLVKADGEQEKLWVEKIDPSQLPSKMLTGEK